MCARVVVVVAICVITVGSTFVDKDDNEMVIQYLQKYGYLNEQMNTFATNADQRVLHHAISLFQEYYKLPGNGKLNNETLNQMRKPRCGLRDMSNLGAGTSIPKWPKKYLTWNFHLAKEQLLNTTQSAFDLWQAHSSLTFERNVSNPNILIAFRESRHMNLDPRNGELCSSELDGPGGTLAHAFYPTGESDFTSEVHVDSTEPWHIWLTKNPTNKFMLLHTLTHEIGHSLGLPHSHNKKSVMYAYAPEITHPVVLSNEDILNIQNLYGAKNTDVSPRTTPEPPTSPTPVPPMPSVPPDLCALKHVDAILLLEKRMYIAYGKHVWAVNIDGNLSGEPLLLSNYMRFIHSNYTRVSAAYQTPSSHLILFVDDKIYKVNYPDFSLVPTWPRTFKNFGLPTDAKINAAVNTNKGRSYVLYNGYLVGEVDDCSDSIVRYHTVDTIFPGIPNGVTSAFRYLDGNLYFTTKRQFYKFNEFTKTIMSAGKFDLRIVNIICPRDGLLQQLRDLLHRIVRTSNALTHTPNVDEDEEAL